MSLIKKSNELVIPTTVKMMIYGQAGMGKSTVALSAPKLLFINHLMDSPYIFLISNAHTKPMFVFSSYMLL